MSADDERTAGQLAEVAAIEARIAEADTFLRMLFGVGTAPPGACITLSVPNREWKPDARVARWLSAHVPVEQTLRAANMSLASDVNKHDDVYVACALTCGDLGKSHRGKIEQKVAIAGVWVDLDLAAPGHVATNLPTYEQALALLDEFALRPTLLIHSGGGTYPWFLFSDGLWSLTDDAERDRAGRLVEGLQAQLGKLMEAHGWHLDGTADLTRVLRLPGTTNRKIAGNPRPVRLLFSDGPRYDRAALLARFEAEAPRKSTARPKSTDGSGRQLAPDDDAPSLLVRAFDYAGMLGDEISGGRFTCICPWEREHTTGRRFDTSTVLFPSASDSRIGGFSCLHGHCKGRGDFLAVLAALPPDAVKRAQAEHDAEQRAELEEMRAAFGVQREAPVQALPKQSTREFCRERMERLKAARPKRGK